MIPNQGWGKKKQNNTSGFLKPTEFILALDRRWQRDGLLTQSPRPLLQALCRVPASPQGHSRTSPLGRWKRRHTSSQAPCPVKSTKSPRFLSTRPWHSLVVRRNPGFRLLFTKLKAQSEAPLPWLRVFLPPETAGRLRKTKMHFSQRKADPCMKLWSSTLLQRCRLSSYKKARIDKSWQRSQLVSSTDHIPAAGSRAGVKQAYSTFKEQTQGEKGK